MTPLERMANLLIMAAADGRMNEAELGFLVERARALGISSDEFHDALQDAVHGTAEVTIPTSPAARRSMLKDLIVMMAADGELADREKQLFAAVAAHIGIDTDELHRIIDATIAEHP